jgi:cytochrome P450
MRLREKLQFEFAKAILATLTSLERLLYGTSINLLDSNFIKDPYSAFNNIRAKRPIHYSIAMQAWWITDFSMAQEILRDKRFGVDVRSFPKLAAKIRKDFANDPERLEVFENPSMISLDPPNHSRIRRLAQQGFLHKFIQSLEPMINEIVDNCLNDAEHADIFDVVKIISQPLPGIVIAKILGIPKAHHDRFLEWSRDMAAGMITNDREKQIKKEIAYRELINCFREIIKEKRVNPGNDLIDQLIKAEEEGDKLTEKELYNTCWLILFGGHETTTRLISNGVYLLLNTPGLWRELGADPQKIPAAVEEILRYEPPVHAYFRYALEDMDFHGNRFKSGHTIYIGVPGANRDPTVTSEPDTFNINRTDIKHISFGYGIHLCIGASLARMEAKVAIQKLITKYPDLRLVDSEAHWEPNPIFRGHEYLRVSKA